MNRHIERTKLDGQGHYQSKILTFSSMTKSLASTGFFAFFFLVVFFLVPSTEHQLPQVGIIKKLNACAVSPEPALLLTNSKWRQVLATNTRWHLTHPLSLSTPATSLFGQPPSRPGQTLKEGVYMQEYYHTYLGLPLLSLKWQFLPSFSSSLFSLARNLAPLQICHPCSQTVRHLCALSWASSSSSLPPLGEGWC